MESIITALITGGLTLIGTVMTVSSGQKKTDHKLEMAQAVTDCKLDELTREVRMHNKLRAACAGHRGTGRRLSITALRT
ncbi:MAG: hypothetical protein ACLR78_04615 [Roseburia sp.]